MPRQPDVALRRMERPQPGPQFIGRQSGYPVTPRIGIANARSGSRAYFSTAAPFPGRASAPRSPRPPPGGRQRPARLASHPKGAYACPAYSGGKVTLDLRDAPAGKPLAEATID
jgi:hypothetical protein